MFIDIDLLVSNVFLGSGHKLDLIVFDGAFFIQGLRSLMRCSIDAFSSRILLLEFGLKQLWGFGPMICLCKVLLLLLVHHNLL